MTAVGARGNNTGSSGAATAAQAASRVNFNVLLEDDVVVPDEQPQKVEVK